MGLFSRKKKDNLPETTFSFVQAPGFKGFKRITLNAQENEQAISDINSIKKPNPKYVESPDIYVVPKGYNISSYPINKYLFNIKNETISILVTTKDRLPFMYVYVAGCLIGTLTPDAEDQKRIEFYNGLISNKVEAIHVRIETHMHNKNCVGEHGKTVVVSEERFKTYLFYKIKEE